MRRTSVVTLVAVLVGVAVVGWPVLRSLEANGVYLPMVPWLVDVAIVVLAAAVFRFGWTVRAYQKGDRPSLDGLRAARTLVLAKAAALTGALLGGWYLAQVLLVLPDLAVEPRRDKAIAAAVAVVCAVGLSVVGLVVERFCQLPPSGGKESDTDGSTATA
ncbi:DUF3180 domain-containing protein [Myceligenerans xiligouense]|uniref:Uncharacterized protein DUF3180 n=1 Tax=Myceligenerans xiligouense TaxID=253184 RepID=A0A3N4YK29_9MICO|nr:DUF3180 domain-containing protein [Myceligenerans xiligouense]RPF19776.1 uncharacterized protein DUF3180 [Myceligenerans xiligouense]